ncbi:MAG TPA: hypothetical protein VFV38_45305, partial [Ktedonobacteraceae bacterium]|nr:hypothetical protein [Ktedonobacteraceae bacterium]
SVSVPSPLERSNGKSENRRGCAPIHVVYHADRPANVAAHRAEPQAPHGKSRQGHRWSRPGIPLHLRRRIAWPHALPAYQRT